MHSTGVKSFDPFVLLTLENPENPLVRL